MRVNLHPVYATTKVVCACGNTFETRSTKDSIRLDICSACHPFFTGQQKLVDTAGRVERFEKRFKSTGGRTVVRKTAAAKPSRKMPAVGTKPAKKGVLTTAPRKAEEKPAGKKGGAKPSKGAPAGKAPATVSPS